MTEYKYLDENGLAYFWGKIKTHVANSLADAAAVNGFFETYTVSYTVGANSTYTGSVSVAKDGYIPIGLAGFSSGNANVTVNRCDIWASDTTVHFVVANPTSTAIDTSFTAKVTYIPTVSNRLVWYAVHTSYPTSTVVLTTTTGNFSLIAGSKLVVKYTNTSTVASGVSTTFNVDGTGAIPVKNRNGSNGYTAMAGEVAEFVYDGTNFVALTRELYESTSRIATSIAAGSTSVSVTFRPRITNPHIDVKAVMIENGKAYQFTEFSYYFSSNPALMVSGTNYTLTISLNEAQSSAITFNISGDIGRLASK